MVKAFISHANTQRYSVDRSCTFRIVWAFIFSQVLMCALILYNRYGFMKNIHNQIMVKAPFFPFKTCYFAWKANSLLKAVKNFSCHIE